MLIEVMQKLSDDPIIYCPHCGEEKMKITVSDTRAYKQFGNSVVVPVIKEIAWHMKPYVLKSMEAKPERAKILSENVAAE